MRRYADDAAWTAKYFAREFTSQKLAVYSITLDRVHGTAMSEEHGRHAVGFVQAHKLLPKKRRLSGSLQPQNATPRCCEFKPVEIDVSVLQILLYAINSCTGQ